MIVKNEEKFLRGCLESVRGIVDEIVIVDTGSTDSTKKIAQEYSAKVFDFNWTDSFADARNFALSKSTGKYILYLDADERIINDSKIQLMKLARSDEQKAYYCKITNIDTLNNRPSVMKYVRFFPNDARLRFVGRIHEQIECSLIKSKIYIFDSKIRIQHLGYNISSDMKEKKALRNLQLLLIDFSENPSSYNAFQLGQTYAILNDKKNAEYYFNLSLNDNHLRAEYLSTAYRYLAINAAERNNLAEAINLCTKSLEADSAQPLTLLILANLNIQIKQFEKANRFFSQAYNLNREIESGKIESFQTIYLDNRSILLESINAFLTADQKKIFEQYLSLLKAANDESCNTDYEVINTFYRKNSEYKLLKQVEYINKGNLPIILNLLRNIDDIAAEKIYTKLNERFHSDSAFLKQYADYYLAIGNLEAAESLLNRSFYNTKDPAIFFYLISFYLKNNMSEKIKPVLETAESKFRNNEIVQKQLLIVKNKLKPFISV